MEKILIKKQLQVLHCILQGSHVCIDIQYVNKILPLLLLEIVPGSPSYLVGLVNLAGKSIPVIDLAIRLGMRRSERYTLETPILLCSYDSHQAGLIVDSVTGIAAMEESMIQMHDEFNEPDAPFIGSITVNEKLALLIDISHLLPVNVNVEHNGVNRKHNE